MSSSSLREAIAVVVVVLALGCGGGAGGSPAPAKDAVNVGIQLRTETFTLPNGLVVVLHPEATARSAYVHVRYDVGSKDDPKGRAGLAHLFEHLMFRRSKHTGDKDFHVWLDEVGADFNATTDHDATNHFEAVPSSQLPLALWLEADRVAYPAATLDAPSFAHERDVVKSEWRERYENEAYGHVWATMYREVFGADHPYGLPTIGVPEQLDAVTLDDVRAFARTYYRPNNATLLVCGGFDPATARQLVTTYFATIPPGPPIAPRSFPAARMASSRTVELAADVPAPMLVMAWPAPPVHGGGWEALHFGRRRPRARLGDRPALRGPRRARPSRAREAPRDAVPFPASVRHPRRRRERGGDPPPPSEERRAAPRSPPVARARLDRVRRRPPARSDRARPRDARRLAREEARASGAGPRGAEASACARRRHRPPGAVQSNVALGWIGPKAAARDAVVLDVLAAATGAGLSSRLNLTVRKELGATYGVRMSLTRFREAGAITVRAAIDTERTAQALRSIVSEIETLRTTTLAPAELASAKLRAGSEDRGTAADLASELAEAIVLGVRAAEALAESARIAGVTADDVRRAAEKWLARDAARLVVVGDASKIAKDLGALGLGDVDVVAAPP